MSDVWTGLESHCHDGVGKNLEDEAEEFQKTNFIPGGLECDKSGCKDRAGRDKLDS